MLSFIPPGVFGVVVVAGLVLVVLVAGGVLIASAVSQDGVEDVRVIDPEVQHGFTPGTARMRS